MTAWHARTNAQSGILPGRWERISMRPRTTYVHGEGDTGLEALEPRSLLSILPLDLDQTLPIAQGTYTQLYKDMIAIDLDGDGAKELIAHDPVNSQLVAFSVAGAAGHQTLAQYGPLQFDTAGVSLASSTFLYSGRFNDDGLDDLIVATSDGTFALLLNDSAANGAGAFRRADTLFVPLASRSPRGTVGDFDGDGIDELLVRAHGDALRYRIQNERFQLVGLISGYTIYGEIVAADLNADGADDMVMIAGVSGGPSGTTQILLMRSFRDQYGVTVGATTTTIPATDGFFSDIAVADINGDQRPDVLAVTAVYDNSRSRFQAVAFTQTPRFRFKAATVLSDIPTNEVLPRFEPDDRTYGVGYNAFTTVSFIYAGDADGDGDGDLVFGEAYNSQSYRLTSEYDASWVVTLSNLGTGFAPTQARYYTSSFSSANFTYFAFDLDTSDASPVPVILSNFGNTLRYGFPVDASPTSTEILPEVRIIQGLRSSGTSDVADGDQIGFSITAQHPLAGLGRTVVRARFFIDTNNSGTYELGQDVLLGNDVNPADGWSFSTRAHNAWSASPFKVSVMLKDNLGVWGAASHTTGMYKVSLPPTLTRLAVEGSTQTVPTLTTGQTFSFRAINVRPGSPADRVERVFLVVDRNQNGIVDNADLTAAVFQRPVRGQPWRVSAKVLASWGHGQVTLLAVPYSAVRGTAVAFNVNIV